MIEVHLRMGDQWPDLYGAGWLDAVVRLHAQREWAFADSVQITFHEEKDPQGHAMTPGGFRLAILNAWSLVAGFAARDMLSACLLGRAA